MNVLSTPLLIVGLVLVVLANLGVVLVGHQVDWGLAAFIGALLADRL